ncbi:MAG: T9SS type A sorting domain-containing protein [Flavobacteriales bacterium]|nr:T9SS type A sorting domain-containing protein [Flavobacteriales bacterium]
MRKQALFLALLLPYWSLAQVPVNDDCANALPLTVHELADCPGLSIAGDNEEATGVDMPSCATTGSMFKDVWYSFNSGPNTEILIDFTFITIDEWGIEVLDGCGGTSVFCDSSAAGYVVPVLASTDYRLRVFTNGDSGSGGVFSMCLSGSAIVPVCDGAMVLSDFGTVDLDYCKDGMADVVDFGSSTGSSESYAFLITDTNDVLIGLFLPPLDFDTMSLGNYRVHGISFDGDLVGAVPGSALDSVSSDGQCHALSTNHITVNVELCNGVGQVNAEMVLSIFPNPSLGDFRVVCSEALEGVDLRLMDLSGRLVQHEQLAYLGADGYDVQLAGRAAAGTYMLNIWTADWSRSLRVVVQ